MNSKNDAEVLYQKIKRKGSIRCWKIVEVYTDGNHKGVFSLAWWIPCFSYKPAFEWRPGFVHSNSRAYPSLSRNRSRETSRGIYVYLCRPRSIVVGAISPHPRAIMPVTCYAEDLLATGVDNLGLFKKVHLSKQAYTRAINDAG